MAKIYYSSKVYPRMGAKSTVLSIFNTLIVHIINRRLNANAWTEVISQLIEIHIYKANAEQGISVADHPCWSCLNGLYVTLHFPASSQ